MCGVISEVSIPFHWSISLFWYQYHAVLITVALYSLKSGSVMPPDLFFLPSLALAMWALVCLHLNFRIVLSNSVKNGGGSSYSF